MRVPEQELAAGALDCARPEFDDALVVDVLSRLAGADSHAGVVDAALPLLLDVPGVRAAAVVLRDRDQAVVVGSAGYACDTLASGATLPLSAGLPVTEAVRTGRPVVQGSGPSWVAVPFGTHCGALLLSLVTAPPADLARLQRITRGLGDALQRAGREERAYAELDLLAGRLAPPPPEGVTLRSLPYGGAAGGDVVLCLPDPRGGRWLVLADVCGAGLPAAILARSVHATLTALVPFVDGPAALLSAADRALRSTVGPGLFVTALVLHEQDGRLRSASAGHPAPVLLARSGARTLDVEPGLPLALEGALPGHYVEQASEVTPGDVLLLHSDGLLDRRGTAGSVTADLPALVAAQPLDDLEELADALLAAADAVGAAGDDVTLLLARPQG